MLTTSITGLFLKITQKLYNGKEKLKVALSRVSKTALSNPKSFYKVCSPTSTIADLLRVSAYVIQKCQVIFLMPSNTYCLERSRENCTLLIIIHISASSLQAPLFLLLYNLLSMSSHYACEFCNQVTQDELPRFQNL
jgi:hypothetical protein